MLYFFIELAPLVAKIDQWIGIFHLAISLLNNFNQHLKKYIACITRTGHVLFIINPVLDQISAKTKRKYVSYYVYASTQDKLES